jgi:hypothetical protein
MGLLKPLGMPQIIRRMMPIAAFCPVLPVRSEILLGLLLVVCLVVEVLAPVAVQIVSAALFVPLAIAVIVSNPSRQIDKDIPGPYPLVPSLAPRAPPVS